ncbi:IS630 transposase-related protein [Clostridium perfringens]|nr:IS630 transposase-related protein [Clostridium perfringens]
MALTDKQINVIGRIIQGEQITNIAKIEGVSRQAIYNWLKNEEFKAELDTQLQEIKTAVKNNIVGKSNSVIDQIIKIALTSKSEKASLNACIYLLDHLLGKPTTKIADVTDQEKENNIDLDKELESIPEIE